MSIGKLVIACACCAILPTAAYEGAAPAARLQVLHWWTSPGERKAADLLVERLARDRLDWADVAIPGGAGLGAGKVLKGRVLAGDAPEVAQMIGPAIAEWADLGLLLELDEVAAAGRWDDFLFPTIRQLVQHRRHVVAAPLGIHRVNTLFYNRALFARLGLAPPATWPQFVAAAAKLRAAGIKPLAQSGEAWQVATLFENLVLAASGPAFYRALFEARSPAAALDARTLEALQRLRGVKGWLADGPLEQPWTAVVREFARGQAGMMIMGDWAKAELREHGVLPGREFDCAPSPGTAGYHLYSVDTLAMFAGDERAPGGPGPDGGPLGHARPAGRLQRRQGRGAGAA